jgi:hydroxypyruvate isomerase
VVKLAASISFLFNEWPFEDRFAAARRVGFRGVEFGVPYGYSRHALAERLREHGLKYLNFLAAPGNWAGGERGIACNPARRDEFRSEFDRAVEWAVALDVDLLHVPAGLVPQGCGRDDAMGALRENLAWAADRVAASGRQVVIEPVNAADIPGFAIHTLEQAIELLRQSKRSNMGLIFDVYHVARQEGDVTWRLRDALSWVRHVQIATPPMRHEPGAGDVDLVWLIDELDRMGYRGWIGCEYRPSKGTVESLDWARRYGIDPSALEDGRP